VKHLKPASRRAIDDFFKWVHNKSLQDLSLNKRVHPDQNSQEFVRVIEEYLSAEVSSLTVRWTMPAAIRAAGDLRRVLPSEKHLLSKLRNGYDNHPALDPFTPETVRRAAREWKKQYSRCFVVDDAFDAEPDLHADLYGKSFSELIDIDKWFCIITPITDQQFLRTQHSKLAHCGWGQMPLEEMLALGADKGWFSCNCNEYQHKMLCHHVLLDAFDKEIVTSFPPGIRANRLSDTGAGNGFRNGVGRPQNSVAGGGLGNI